MQAYALASSIPPESVQDPHHLFLVDHDPVGLFQDVVQDGVQILGLFAAMFDRHIIVDHAPFQRTGSIERRSWR